MSVFSDINNDITGNAYRWITPFKEVTGMVPVGYVLARDGSKINQTDKRAAYELMDQAMESLERRAQCIRLIREIQADPIAMASPQGNERQSTYRMCWMKSSQSFFYLLKFAAELYQRHGLSVNEVTPEMRRNGTLAFRDVSWTLWRSGKSTAGRAGYVNNMGGKLYVFDEPRDWIVFADEQLVSLRDQFGLSTRDGSQGTLQGGQMGKAMGEPLTTGAIVLYCVIAITLAVIVVATLHSMNLSEFQEVDKQDREVVKSYLDTALAARGKYLETGDPKYLVAAQEAEKVALQLDKTRTERAAAAGDSLDPFGGLADAFKGASTMVAAVTVAAVLYFAAPYILAFIKSRKGGEA